MEHSNQGDFRFQSGGNLEIYFSDLNEDAQRRYLEFFELETPKEGNLDIDIIPIFELNAGELDWEGWGTDYPAKKQ